MKQLINQLLREIGPGKMSKLAYDTACVAKMGDIDRELSNRAIAWISANQLPDGSWGAEYPYYYHDRIISTLAVMLALTKIGRRMYDRSQVERGLLALEHMTDGATQRLQADPNGATVGFEMIVPTLVAEAERVGVIKQQGDRILGRLKYLRNAKMEKIRGFKINRTLTPAFSSEMAGTDNINILDIENLQEKNGSVGNSPSATAYFVSTLRKNDLMGMSYLRKWVSEDGGTPDVAPFDVFEPAWVIWNLQLANCLDNEALELCKPHLDFLEKSWIPGLGIGNSANAPKDGDDTGLVYEVLKKLGRMVDIDAVLHYEDSNYFRCFDLEANPSTSSNIHILGALQQAGYDKKHPSMLKALNFVRQSQVFGKYWTDKWHISPYYATGHAVIICKNLDENMCQIAIDWILDNQQKNGGWGFYDFATAEETAYCLQALCIWHQHGHNVPAKLIQAGSNWLKEHAEPPYHPFWIGKGLYCPENVVKSTILSALILSQ